MDMFKYLFIYNIYMETSSLEGRVINNPLLNLGSVAVVSKSQLQSLAYMPKSSYNVATCTWLCSSASCGQSCGRCENCSCGYTEDIGYSPNGS